MIELNFSPFPVLFTPRLCLRELFEEDVYNLKELRSNASVNEFIDRPKTNNLSDAFAFIQKIRKFVEENESIYWVITEKEKNTLIGTICFWNIDKVKNIAETGFELFPDYQGKGIMQEAFTKILDYGFMTLGFKIITGLTHPSNMKSIRLLERNHFLLDDSFKYVSEEDAGGMLIFYKISPNKEEIT
jgi:RimJ/RimL family protein N-acetyltransferase